MVGHAQTVLIAGRKLRLTNPDKVLYPATDTTKAEVLQYLLAAAPVMLPHLAGRLCTRKRWPEGVGTPGEVFFEKNLPDHAPDWIRRVRVEHTHRAPSYPVVESEADLAWFGQMNALELHVHQWQVDPDGTPVNPDRLVLDLDPGPGASLADCAVVAHEARDLLADVGLATVPVTSGRKGLHLYAKLDGTLDADYINSFAKQIAQGLELRLPKLVVSSMAKSARRGKVLVDWSQNNPNKTTISPYSLRGTFHPMVAAPRDWGEIGNDLAQLDFEAMLERLDDDPLAALADTSRSPEPTPTESASSRSASVYAHRSTPIAAATALPRASTRADTSVMLASPASNGVELRPGEWAFEMKWDGIRALALLDQGAVTLLSRNGNDITDSYPEVATALVALDLGPAVFDGELVAFSNEGLPDFGLLQQRMGVHGPADVRAASVCYLVFDLLEIDSTSIRNVPFHARRSALDYLELGDAPGTVVRVPKLFTGTLNEAVQVSVDARLEGVVAKHHHSPYRQGRSKSWLKFKNIDTTDVVVVGWSPGSGTRKGTVASLLLAVHRNGDLSYAGRVGSGFSAADLEAISDRLAPLEQPSAPVAGIPRDIARSAVWVQPRLVAEVAFAGWTHSGHIRHATWRGWRPDVPLNAVVGETT